jgi:hypothetical protein
MNDDHQDEDTRDLFDDWDDEDIELDDEDIEPDENHDFEDKHYINEVEEGYGDKEAKYAKADQPVFNIEELDI